MKRHLKTGLAVVAAGTLFAIGGVSTATAAKLITGKDIVDGSVQKRDLGPGVQASLTGNKGDQGPKGDAGAQGPKGNTGATGPQGPAGSVAYTGANWGIVHRNVIGNGAADLQSGPRGAGALGDGALMIRTGSATDKAAFGNEVDFAGQALPTQIGYSVFTTGENNASGAPTFGN